MTPNQAAAIASIHKFSRDLTRLPLVVGQKVARECAQPLTDLSQETYEASETPYGVPWEPAKGGGKVTLKQSGAMAKGNFYVAIGTFLRMRLSAAHAKYQVGKRRIAPGQGEKLPAAWSALLARKAVEVIKRELGVGS